MANFGRMPDGWVKSSQNNVRLAARGLVRRGYADPTAFRPPDHPSVLDLDRFPQADDWAGLPWSRWDPPLEAPAVRGVYRVRSDRAGLVYLGQGNVRARLRSHLAKIGIADHRQQAAFSGDVESSWAELPAATSQQLLEIECDLIASHVLQIGVPPAAQFLG